MTKLVTTLSALALVPFLVMSVVTTPPGYTTVNLVGGRAQALPNPSCFVVRSSVNGVGGIVVNNGTGPVVYAGYSSGVNPSDTVLSVT